MTEDHDALGQPLRARGANEVLVQHFQDARTRQPGHPRDGIGAERQRRQHHVRQRAASRRGQHPEVQREDQDQDDPEPEGRDALADEGGHQGEAIGHAVPARGRQDSDRDPHESRQEQCRRRQLERRRQGRQHERQGGLVVPQREAEVPRHGPPQKTHVLQGQRVSEAELFANALDLGRPGILRDVEQRRIARETEEKEQRGVDAEHHDHQEEEASCQ